MPLKPSSTVFALNVYIIPMSVSGIWSKKHLSTFSVSKTDTEIHSLLNGKKMETTFIDRNDGSSIFIVVIISNLSSINNDQVQVIWKFIKITKTFECH